MALAKVKEDATLARVAASRVPEGATWNSEARKKALSRVTSMGLPVKRDEYWKYTDPQSLVAVDVSEAALFHNDEGPLFDDIDRVKIVFVDGAFDEDRSTDLAADGVVIERLADIAKQDIHWAKDLYGVLEERGQTPVERPFAALNTAIATDGVVIRATDKVSKPINLVYLHNDTTSDATLHNLVKVEAGAEVTLLETGPAAARFSKCLEVDVADGGTFHHVRA